MAAPWPPTSAAVAPFGPCASRPRQVRPVSSRRPCRQALPPELAFVLTPAGSGPCLSRPAGGPPCARPRRAFSAALRRAKFPAARDASFSASPGVRSRSSAAAIVGDGLPPPRSASRPRPRPIPVADAPGHRTIARGMPRPPRGVRELPLRRPLGSPSTQPTRPHGRLLPDGFRQVRRPRQVPLPPSTETTSTPTSRVPLPSPCTTTSSTSPRERLPPLRP